MCCAVGNRGNLKFASTQVETDKLIKIFEYMRLESYLMKNCVICVAE